MDKEKLKKILSDHKEWLLSNGQSKEKADLSDADLSDADLSDADLMRADLREANLRRAVGNKLQIKSMQIEIYSIAYTVKFLQIGCQQHSFEKWKNFDDVVIKKMDSQALDFWKKWKDWIFKLIEMSPAE